MISNQEQNNKAKTLEKINGINEVEGFDPISLAVEYSDLNTGEKRQYLPVWAQIAWFRLKYPDGRLAVKVKPSGESFEANVRVYKNCNDPLDNYLAEATASRALQTDKSVASIRQWAQTVAIGVALRNSGFGLPFCATDEILEYAAGNEPVPSAPAAENKDLTQSSNGDIQTTAPDMDVTEDTVLKEPTQVPAASDLTAPEESPLEKAMKIPCPGSKFKGKTLGDMVTANPGIFTWIIEKFGEDSEMGAAAKLICEHAVQVAAQ